MVCVVLLDGPYRLPFPYSAGCPDRICELRASRAQERAKASYPGKTFKLPADSSECGSADRNCRAGGMSGRKYNCVCVSLGKVSSS